jgi:hypothetical protein
VAKQDLDGADILFLLEQVRGKAVTQRVQGDALINVCSHGGLVHGAVQLPGTHGLHRMLNRCIPWIFPVSWRWLWKTIAMRGS